MPRSSFISVLQTFASHRVDFIVVGGVAAVLRGAPVGTFDLDVVHSTAPENIGKLLAALEDLDACYRTRPDTTHLSSPGRQLLMTRFGPVDLLGTIGKGRSYEALLPHALEMELAKELQVRVLDLETLITIKEEVGGEKDIAMLPVLRRTLEESR